MDVLLHYKTCTNIGIKWRKFEKAKRLIWHLLHLIQQDDTSYSASHQHFSTPIVPSCHHTLRVLIHYWSWHPTWQTKVPWPSNICVTGAQAPGFSYINICSCGIHLVPRSSRVLTNIFQLQNSLAIVLENQVWYPPKEGKRSFLAPSDETRKEARQNCGKVGQTWGFQKQWIWEGGCFCGSECRCRWHHQRIWHKKDHSK